MENEFQQLNAPTFSLNVCSYLHDTLKYIALYYKGKVKWKLLSRQIWIHGSAVFFQVWELSERTVKVMFFNSFSLVDNGRSHSCLQESSAQYHCEKGSRLPVSQTLSILLLLHSVATSATCLDKCSSSLPCLFLSLPYSITKHLNETIFPIMFVNEVRLSPLALTKPNLFRFVSGS